MIGLAGRFTVTRHSVSYRLDGIYTGKINEAKSVPALSTRTRLRRQFCVAFRVVGQAPAAHHGAACWCR